MKILIVEDELVAAQRIQSMVAANIPDAHIAGVCDSVEETVNFLSANEMPDLMLMDIELADGKSFEIFDEVKITCPVIFTTAYDEYVMKAFSVHSIDYLLKPIETEALKKSIAKFRELQKVYAGKETVLATDLIAQLRQAVAAGNKTVREHFLVKHGHKLLSIHTSEVAYFYSENGITYLKTGANNFYAIDDTLDELEEHVDPKNFHRCSRKFLVNRSAIQSAFLHFNGKLKLTVKPSPSEDVIVSRDRAAEFKKWMGG